MPDITTSAVREIGRVAAADGEEVVIGVDCDAVTILAPRRAILGAAQYEEFTRVYFTAVWQAEAWRLDHESDVVEAEVWCGWPSDCVSGPADHLWDGSCREKAAGG